MVLLVTVSIAATYDYWREVVSPFANKRMEIHDSIIDRTALSPYRYRLLAPWLAEIAHRPLLASLEKPEALSLTYATFNGIVITFGMLCIFGYLRIWYQPIPALAGCLYVAALIPLAMADHFFQPWSWLQFGLFPLAILLIHRQKWILLGLVIFVGSVNRETGLFLALLYPACCFRPRQGAAEGLSPWQRWQPAVLAAGYLAIWAVVFLGLRIALGHEPHMRSIAGFWELNVDNHHVRDTILHMFLFFSGPVILAIFGVRNAPKLAIRALWIVPPYLAAFAIFSVWSEVRVLLPIQIMLLPLALAALTTPVTNSQDTQVNTN